jgi:uncharacterized protein (TIGR00369 family)
MKAINPLHAERIKSLVNRCPYFQLLSMRLLSVEVGGALLEIDLERKHLQPFGIVHGGVFASIVDAAAFWSIYYVLEDSRAGLTTVDLKLNYLAPAVRGKMSAAGSSIKLGRTMGYAQASVRGVDGQLLAHGTSTLMVLPGRAIADDPPLPEKFLQT